MLTKSFKMKSKARNVGTFDYKETYRVLFEWLLQEGYEVNETAYKEIITTPGPIQEKEVDVFWEATKNISDYFKFLIKIRFHPLKMSAIEVEIDGVKQKLNKGDFTIEFDCTLIKDYNNKWKSDFLMRLYDKYLIRERTEQYEAKLMSEFEALVEYAKAFLVLTGRR